MFAPAAGESGMVADGFRARLETESLVTGVLYIGLDINPQADPPEFHQLEPEFAEIPSEPTQIEELIRNLAEFDLSGLSDKLDAILDKLDRSLNELDVKQINDGIVNTLAAAENILEDPEFGSTIKSLRETLDEIKTLVAQVNEKFDPLSERINRTLDHATASLAQLEAGVHDLRDLIAPQSPLAHELGLAINELTKAAQSIAAFVDYLNRNPKALITGKKRTQTTP